MSLNFGLEDYDVLDIKKRFKLYRTFVYENGGLETNKKCPIDKEIVKKERARDYELSRMEIFRYRTRYFTEGAIIGSKEFVSSGFERFKKLIKCKGKRQPRKIAGIDGIYSFRLLKGQ
ncbi:hypothetical protein [Desulfovulcanus sp.]